MSRQDGGTGSLVDLHSHLVPSVDDGARTLDDVLEGVERMWERGVRTVVTTPHLSGSLTLEREALRERLDRVEEAFALAHRAVGDRFPELRFLQGHEVMLDYPEPDLSDRRLRLASSNWVLVEWPRLQIPPRTGEVIRSIMEQGVRLLIAHPERYLGYDEEMTVVKAWRTEGARLQVNYGSLLGRYGPEARRRAFRLLAQGEVDMLATDFHGRSHLRLYLRETRELFEEMGEEEAWDLLTSVNPGRILTDEMPVPVGPVSKEEGFFERLRSLFR